MPSTDSPAVIVARFLRANNYNESYDAFIDEAGLPPDAGTVSKGDLTLEVLLEEKKNFDLSVQFEKLGTSDGETGWSKPSPENATVLSTLPSSSNILQATVQQVRLDGDTSEHQLFTTTADRRLTILDTPGCSLKSSYTTISDSPMLSCVVLGERRLLISSMSGHLTCTDLSGKSIDQRHDHTKYIVQIALLHNTQHAFPLIATAGWDNKINIYLPHASSAIGNLISTITLPSKPESILFLTHPENQQPILLVSRTDSSSLHYYTIPGYAFDSREPRLLGRQNLAPHSNAWVAFTPSALALSPRDPTLLAVATSAVPSMKLLIVRLLIPPWDSSLSQPTVPAPLLRISLLDETPAGTETQASQARAALLVADREHSAIQIHCTTLSPQTAYSTPAVAWRPDGSGVWVNGDDGVVRGIEATTGKIVATLKGHEPGSKVRCLWAGKVGEEEWLVSGGFDQKLIVWKV